MRYLTVSHHMSHRPHDLKDWAAFVKETGGGPRIVLTMTATTRLVNAAAALLHFPQDRDIGELAVSLEQFGRSTNTPLSQPPQDSSSSKAAAQPALATPSATAPMTEEQLAKSMESAYPYLSFLSTPADRPDVGALSLWIESCDHLSTTLKHYVRKMDRYFPPCKKRYFRIDQSAYAFVAASHTGGDPSFSNRAMIDRFANMVGFDEAELNVALMVMEWACVGKVNIAQQHTPLGVIKLRHLLGRFAFILAFVTDTVSYHNAPAEETRRAFDEVSRAIDTTRPRDSIYGPLSLNADGRAILGTPIKLFEDLPTIPEPPQPSARPQWHQPRHHSRSPTTMTHSPAPRHIPSAGVKRQSEPTTPYEPTPSRSKGERDVARDRGLCVRCYRSHQGEPRDCTNPPIRSVKAYLHLTEAEAAKYNF